jgi:hypothetical protein
MKTRASVAVNNGDKSIVQGAHPQGAINEVFTILKKP